MKDPDVFRCFRVDSELDTIVWATGADLAPEFLYEQVVLGASPTATSATRDRRVGPRASESLSGPRGAALPGAPT